MLRRFVFVGILLSLSSLAGAEGVGDLSTDGNQSMWWVAIALALGTFISEDISALTGAGIVALEQASAWFVGGALFLGIWLGDIGLWLVGRYGRKTGAHLPGLRRIGPVRLVQARRFLRRWGWGAILLSRVIPGSRLPFIAAGAVHWSLLRLPGTALAVGIWTAAIMLLADTLGVAAVQLFGETIQEFGLIFAYCWCCFYCSSGGDVGKAFTAA